MANIITSAKSRGCCPGRRSSRAFLASTVPKKSQDGVGCLDPTRMVHAGSRQPCTVLAFLWHGTGKEGPADAPPGTASFGFGEFVVTILVRRAKTCPSGVSPSPSGTVVAPEVALDMHPAPVRDMHCDDSSSDQHKSDVPDRWSPSLLALIIGLLVSFRQL